MDNRVYQGRHIDEDSDTLSFLEMAREYGDCLRVVYTKDSTLDALKAIWTISHDIEYECGAKCQAQLAL
jgi:hypothetical protein